MPLFNQLLLAINPRLVNRSYPTFQTPEQFHSIIPVPTSHKLPQPRDPSINLPKRNNHPLLQPLPRIPKIKPHLIIPQRALVIGVEEWIHASPFHRDGPSDMVEEEGGGGEPG